MCIRLVVYPESTHKFQKVPGIHWYNLQELLVWINKCTLTSVISGMQWEGNALKNGEPTVGFSFTTMLQHTGQFWSRISEQGKIWQHLSAPYSSDLAPSDLYRFPQLKLALKWQSFCDATDIIKNVMEELKSLPQNGIQEHFKHIYSYQQKFVVAKEDCFEGNLA